MANTRWGFPRNRFAVINAASGAQPAVLMLQRYAWLIITTDFMLKFRYEAPLPNLDKPDSDSVIPECICRGYGLYYTRFLPACFNRGLKTAGMTSCIDVLSYNESFHVGRTVACPIITS